MSPRLELWFANPPPGQPLIHEAQSVTTDWPLRSVVEIKTTKGVPNPSVAFLR